MGLTFDKLFVILIIAVFIVGPERLPRYAQKVGELVRQVKKFADGAKDRLKDEMGPEFDEVDWKQLDPRQYDPRRIIRDALLNDDAEAGKVSSAAAGAAGAAGAAAGIAAGRVAVPTVHTRKAGDTLNFDTEAT